MTLARSHARRALITATLTASLVTASVARADDNAAAEALFQQAKSLTEQQQWGEACPKFEASYKLDKTLGTLLNLADCEEHVGKIATAWAHWGEAVELAEKAGDKRAEFAGKRRAAIKDRLPYVRLDVTVGKAKLDVYRDGVRIDPAAFGVPLPSDPGEHTIAVRRGEETLTERRVTAAERATAGVTLDLEAIARAAPPPAQPVSSTQRKAGWGVLGAGAGIFAIAAGLEVGALLSKSQAGGTGGCVGKVCTPTGFESVTRARTLANAGQWLGIGGLLITAVGVTIVATAPSSKPARSSTLRFAPYAGPGGGGLLIEGSL